MIYYFADALIKYLEYVNSMQLKDLPDYAKCRTLFENYLKSEGKSRNGKLEFTKGKKGKVKANIKSTEDSEDEPVNKGTKGDAPRARRGRKPAIKDQDTDSDDNCENGIKETSRNKRKSTEPPVVKVKKTKLAPRATPPMKKNYANSATQTSKEKIRTSPRKVTFDSPICENIGEKKSPRKTKKSTEDSINSSGDIFEDSFVIEEKRVKPRRKLLSDEEVSVKRVIKKKLTTVKSKAKSWKDLSTVVNGRSPPK